MGMTTTTMAGPTMAIGQQDMMDIRPGHDESEKEMLKNEGGGGGASAADAPPTAEKQQQRTTADPSARDVWWRRMPRAFASAVIGSLQWFFATLAAPAVYLMACFHGAPGVFAPLHPLRRLFGIGKSVGGVDGGEGGGGSSGVGGQQRVGYGTFDGGATWQQQQQHQQQQHHRQQQQQRPRHLHNHGDGDSETDTTPQRRRVPSRHSRSAAPSTGEISPARRSIRIKLSQDALVPRENRRAPSAAGRSSRSSSVHSTASAAPTAPSATAVTPATSASGSEDTTTTTSTTTTEGNNNGRGATDHSVQFKSPTSPAVAALTLTRYPKTPAPPRPLVPRRQPSYLNIMEPTKKHQKTLILDLDETLIHSMSKGGRMSTGHMVEVRLTTTYVGHGGQTAVGPQHPILYWVNKRPHCDEFLRRVCKWYNLVIFTASVPEYADPVIDWLEQERKFFSGRYYRQHCTFRQGAFIKDLSSVEPDLSRVMILDNSPLSYMFHQDNAIPIQGWINDPTDNDLLHLVPLLEGLQYVSDVRALLALRGGEDGQHMA